MNQADRISALKSLLRERILIIDGAMGTAIQARGLGLEDFGGAEYEGCNEYLVLTRPDVIAEIHQGFLEYWTPCGLLASAPAISIPFGFSSQGLPIELQLGGHPGGDERALNVAHAYEQGTPWHTMRPPMHKTVIP